MKTPLWMINCILLLLGLLVLGFIMFLRIKIPSRATIDPDPSSIAKNCKEISKVQPKVQLSRIYNNDLFNTYIPTPSPTVEPIKKPELPKPPQPQKYTPPTPPAPTFLDPLNVNLKGIIWQGSEEDSRAIIADQTGKQKVYQVGDKIEDSYILDIFERKIILIRSNGQQEILYINKDEAVRDRENDILRRLDYSKIIRQLNSTTFSVDPNEFVKVVQNLGRFIDVLHLSSVYSNGEPLGVRIGSLEEGTLGTALGLKENDVIIDVNNIEATDIKKRLLIYNNIIALPLGSTIRVSILRGGAQTTFYYKIEKAIPDVEALDKIFPSKTPEEIQKEQKQIATDAQKLMPMKIGMKKEDKRVMLKKGTRQPLFKTVT